MCWWTRPAPPLRCRSSACAMACCTPAAQSRFSTLSWWVSLRPGRPCPLALFPHLPPLPIFGLSVYPPACVPALAAAGRLCVGGPQLRLPVGASGPAQAAAGGRSAAHGGPGGPAGVPGHQIRGCVIPSASVIPHASLRALGVAPSGCCARARRAGAVWPRQPVYAQY